MIGNEQVYRNILEFSSDNFFIMNADGELLSFSKSVPDLIGYTREELLKMTVFDWDKQLTRQEYTNTIKNIQDTPEIFERVHTRKDGTTYLAQVTVVHLVAGNKSYFCSLVRDITEQRKNDILLKDNSDFISRLSKQIPGVIYQYQYFPDGRSCFPYASDHIWDIYEATAAEVKDDASIVLSRLHPEDSQMVIDSIVESYQNLTPWQCDYRVLLPQKGLRWLRGFANPEKLDDQSVVWHGYIHDITAIKKTESALKDSFRDIQLKNEKINSLLRQQNFQLETQLKKVLDSSLNGIQYFKSIRNEHNEIIDFEYIFSNGIACEIIKKTEEEIIGKRLLEILPKHAEIIPKYGKSLFEMYCEVVKTGESKDLMFNYKEGLLDEWFSNKVVKLDDGFVVNFAVVTDLIKNIKLEKLNIELQKQVKKEVANNRKKDEVLRQQSKFIDMGRMISAIAHQWRQPLNNISLISQMMEEMDSGKTFDIDKSELYQQHQDIVHYMSKTIDDFRNYFSNKKERSNFSLVEEINNTLNLFNAQLSSHGILVEMNIKGKDGSKDKENPFIFHGNSGDFRQICMNILNNAHDAIIDFKKKQPNNDAKIIISLIGDSLNYHITIENNGYNIPEDILDKIFQPYFTTKDEGKGTGIGLYMSRMIIEQEMNGKIYARNTDSGVAFHISLPRLL